MSALTVDINPSKRKTYLEQLLMRDGLHGVTEDVHAAYCAISLTTTPAELKPFLHNQQQLLMDVLTKAGITPYDPYSAPSSPDKGLTITPDEIYRHDKRKIVGARYFVTHDLLPSTGVGVETETARTYNRIAVILHNKNIRTSRMQPNRTIHLSYDNFEKQQADFIRVFLFLKQFEPGIGFEKGKPVLLGFDKNEKAFNLEKETYEKFPQLIYTYDGKVDNAKLICENCTIFS